MTRGEQERLRGNSHLLRSLDFRKFKNLKGSFEHSLELNESRQIRLMGDGENQYCEHHNSILEEFTNNKEVS